MCTVAEICSTGVRVTLSDVPEVLLTATNSEPSVQDAGLAAKAGTLSGTASDFGSTPFFFAGRFSFERLFQGLFCARPLRPRIVQPHTFTPIHALLADEVRTRRSKHRRSRQR